MYSNIGYEIATVVLEVLAEEPWYAYVERTFWNVLEMKRTVPGIPALRKHGLESSLSAGHIGVIPASYTAATDQSAIDTYDMLDPLTPKLAGGIKNGFLGDRCMRQSLWC